MFGWLFGRKADDPAKKDVPPMRDLRALVEPLAVPAVQVVLQAGPSRSHFGGDPALPAGVPWPEKDGRRLAFLARLSLQEIRGALPVPWLPETGALLFFYDMDKLPWGFDPTDRGSWAVLLVPDFSGPVPEPAREVRESRPTGADGAVPHRNVALRRIEMLPSSERPAVKALALTDAEDEAYFDLTYAVVEGGTRHQVAGLPSPVQNDDMELECQLASHGISIGGPSGYEDPRVPALEPGAANWRLLFQIDSDDELAFMWGDLGRLYFWVEEDAARAGNFTNAWLVLQCS